MTDTSMDRALREALGRQATAPAGACPDTNLLAAYLESKLAAPEAAGVEAHASGCASCRETLALAMKLSDDPPTVSGEDPGHVRRKVLFRISIPLAAVAAVLLVVAAQVIYYRYYKESQRQLAVSETAQLRFPKELPERSGLLPSEEKSPLQALTEDKAPVAAAPEAKAPVKAGVKKERRSLDREPAAPEAAKAVAQDVMAEALRQEPAADFAAAAPAAAAAAQPLAESAEPSLRADRAQSLAREPAALAPRGRMMQSVAHRESLPGPKSAILALGKDDGAKDKKAAKNFGGKSFVQESGYWIDLECGAHAEAPIVEIGPDSSRLEEIKKALPALEELLDTRTPILLFWNGSNYVIR